MAADKTDNITGQLADLEACNGDPAKIAKSLARFKGGYAGTLWYYRNMYAAMGDKLADSALYQQLGELIARFEAAVAPSEDELATRSRVLEALISENPCAAKNAAEYYSIDAQELARRFHAAGPGSAHEVVLTHAARWYGDPKKPGQQDSLWADVQLQAIARALAG